MSARSGPTRPGSFCILQSMNETFRTESDSMGKMQVPASAYYGAQTARAVENFPISNLRFPREFIRALGLIKKHSAITNAELGLLDGKIAHAIQQAAEEVIAGKLAHPNDYVNRGQSSNDVIPTAIHLAALTLIEKGLRPALQELRERLQEKAVAFRDILKIGRTHLQDATPIRLGQEFGGYASQIAHGLERLNSLQVHLGELAL